MRKGRMPSLIALLLVNGPIRTGAQPGALVLTQRRLGTIWERIVPRLPSGSKNVGTLRVAAAVPVADRARTRGVRARSAADPRGGAVPRRDDRCAFEPGSDHPEMLAIGHCVAMRGGHLCTTHGGACMSRALLILSS